jgi:dUTP pyrophosphatase
MPTKGSFAAGGYDIYMPESGNVSGNQVKIIGLGFAAEVPSGHVALLLPRSGAGAKYGVELNNTCGVIDADYRGEWKAAIRTKSGAPFRWEADDRVLQFILVPVLDVRLELVDDLSATERGAGHFGSSGK